MKKLINGLLYDTEKSELLYQDNDMRRSYYMTKKKRYFILYRTGEIGPISEQRIMDILIMYDYDKYVELFGNPEEA